MVTRSMPERTSLFLAILTVYRPSSSGSFCEATLRVKKFNPRENLTVEQNELLNEFIQKLEVDGLTPKERKVCLRLSVINK
jgi:hypothetical protein